jgi:hypothetical protein
LRNYYKVSLKRFVDAVCRQAIEDSLLFGDQSPLKVFTPEFVMEMDDATVRAIFGDDAATIEKRKQLEKELAPWEEAVKILGEE